VFINGSPIGGIRACLVGNLLGGNGSTFTPNTTLTDILTGGGGVANQNVIQNRIDQAFGTNGIAQDLIQSRIDQAFGPANNAFGTIFSSGIGGSTSSLTGSMAQYASAIKSIESAGSGGYSALGPMLKNGNQALGAYQVMKSNLPSWSTQAFGSPMSPQQFLGNPAAQDTVFEQQFGKLLSKYGNSNDAASAWFTGGPLSSRAGASDILGTTGSQYVDKFNAALGQATQNVGQLGGASSGALSSLVSSTSQAAGGLNQLGSGAGKLGSMLSQFPAAPGGGGGGLGGLGSLFGSLFGGGASIGSMNAISPAATADILSGSWGLFANGAAFRRGNVVPFAKGDVFSSPTYFPMSAGRTGVMGEDGEEAIMPLRRGPDGRLGVVNHQPLRAPRAANGNAAGGGFRGRPDADHIEGIVNSIADKLKLNANIINLNDGSDIKRYLMSEDGHETVAIVNKRLGRLTHVIPQFARPRQRSLGARRKRQPAAHLLGRAGRLCRHACGLARHQEHPDHQRDRRPHAVRPQGDVSAITDGAVSANGNASHWAMVDTVNSRLLAAKALDAVLSVNNGDTFTCRHSTSAFRARPDHGDHRALHRQSRRGHA
jgi:hypothetical protein